MASPTRKVMRLASSASATRAETVDERGIVFDDDDRRARVRRELRDPPSEVRHAEHDDVVLRLSGERAASLLRPISLGHVRRNDGGDETEDDHLGERLVDARPSALDLTSLDKKNESRPPSANSTFDASHRRASPSASSCGIVRTS